MGILTTLLEMKYEVLRIQLLFLSTGIPAPLQASVPLSTQLFRLSDLFCCQLLVRVNLGSQVTCQTCCLNSQGFVSILRDSQQTLPHSAEMILLPEVTQTAEVDATHSLEQQNGRELGHELLVMNSLTHQADCKDLARGQPWLLGSAAEFPLVAAMLGVTLVLLCAPCKSCFERLLTCFGASSLNEFCLLH